MSKFNAITNSRFQLILDYLSEIDRLFRSGDATELSYRPKLQQLLENLLKGYDVINDAKRIDCGAPDLMIKKGGAQISFVETKPIMDLDLDGKGSNKEQFDRYKKALDVIVFTNFLDFHLYVHENYVTSVEIATIKENKIVPLTENFDNFFNY